MFAQRSFGYVATLILTSAFLFCILPYCYIVTSFTWRISLACWGRRSLCSKLLASYRLSLVLGNLYLEWQFKKKISNPCSFAVSGVWLWEFIFLNEMHLFVLWLWSNALESTEHEYKVVPLETPYCKCASCLFLFILLHQSTYSFHFLLLQ